MVQQADKEFGLIALELASLHLLSTQWHSPNGRFNPFVFVRTEVVFLIGSYLAPTAGV